MAITKADKQELDQIHSDHCDTYKGCKEDYFACLYLTKKFKVRVEDIARQCSFGNNDYGIDAYHVDRESKNLYLYQFKWSENHNLFKESLERLAKDGMERIFGNPLQDPNQNELLRNLKADLFEHQSMIQRVFVHFVFKGDIDAAENSEGLRDRRENLENKKYIIHEFFKNEQVDLRVEFITDRRVLPAAPPVDSHQLSFTDAARVQTADGERIMHVGFLPLMDLYRIYKGLGQRFLNRNIRSGLSADNPPNAKIREALTDIVLKSKMLPELFVFNHNGVTLAAEHLSFEGGHAVVKVPRLLNGAQTITSVAKFFDDNDGNPLLKTNAERMEAIKVLAKIIVDDPFSEFVTNVTVCNNRQNPVEPWNLRANDRIQCDLHDKFIEEAHIFYSRQENAFRNLSNEDLEELGVEDLRDMRIRPLAQTFLAVQGEISRMSQLPEVFENQKQYDDCFRESYLQSDARKIILAYKVHLVLKSPMQRLEERAGQHIVYAISRARNLVWALLIQGMLNDPELNSILEEYGIGLGRETQFREYLKTLASTRILPILREVLSDKEYKDRIDNERYDFLRTKEIFKRCSDVAYDKYDWTKKSF